jgi:UDP-N-acetylmuramyl tripeptide synthase
LGENLEVGRSLARLLKAAGRWTARASADGLFLDDWQTKSADHSDLDGSRAALVSPQVETAVLERRLASIRNEGLGVDRFDAVIVTRLTQNGERGGGVCLAPELERALRLLVESAVPGGAVVIDADDRVAAAVTESVRDSTIFVSARPGGTSMPTSNRRGGRMICLRESDLVLVSRDRTERFFTLEGRLRSQLAGGGRLHGLLAAVAAVWSMGMPVDMIRAGCNQLTWS